MAFSRFIKNMYNRLKRAADSSGSRITYVHSSDPQTLPESRITHVHSSDSQAPSDLVTPYEKLIETAEKTKEGLYPPEVIMIYYCGKTNKYPAKSGQKYPVYWWYEYGIGNIDKFLKDIEGKGLIQLENDLYKPTKKGEEVIRNNEAIIWAHQTKVFGGAWGIIKILDDVPDRIKTYSWRDKVWYHLNRQAVQYLDEANRSRDITESYRALVSYRNVLLNQAQFLEYEKKYNGAVDIYKKILDLDEKINEVDAAKYRECDIEYAPMPVAPGIVHKIEQLQKKLKSGPRTNKSH